MNENQDRAAPFQIRVDGEGEDREIAESLAAEIAQRFGPSGAQPVSIVLRTPEGSVAAGLNGVSHWRWLYVRHVFVAPAQRGQGLGRKLMALAEKEARRRGCIGVYLDTFSEDTASFYERLGFTRCGRIEDFPVGGARIYLRKTL
jgi:GNAT superfamily N-acetyltransferase